MVFSTFKRATSIGHAPFGRWKHELQALSRFVPAIKGRLLFPGCGGCFPLFGARPAEGVEHRIVAFVARVFEIPITAFLGKREPDLERPDICFRIVHRHFIAYLVGSHPRVTLDQFQRLARRSAPAIGADRGLAAQEILGLDHQSVPLPMPSRMPI